jgi:ADP-ribose pyrophosphatase YjhB (NUDIX family)
MTYCSSCGSPLPHGAPVRCLVCATDHWRNPKPAAAALVTRKRQLLLVRRAHEPWLGRWCAPSGFCDHDEHPITTAQRETFEETGLEVTVTGYLGTWVSDYAENDASGTGRDDDVVIAVAYYHAERDRYASPRPPALIGNGRDPLAAGRCTA